MRVRLRLAIGVAIALGAPGPAAVAQTRGAAPAQLQPVTRTAIDQLADSLGGEGLPTAPLYDKAAEGMLKGADDARILVAVRGLAQRLREARRLLGPATTDAELSAGASALHVGAPAALIRALAATRDERLAGRSLGLPLVVLANLIADGVPASVAGESLTTLMLRGARDEDLGTFRWNVARDIQEGKTPSDAAHTVTERLLHTITAKPAPP